MLRRLRPRMCAHRSNVPTTVIAAAVEAVLLQDDDGADEAALGSLPPEAHPPEEVNAPQPTPPARAKPKQKPPKKKGELSSKKKSRRSGAGYDYAAAKISLGLPPSAKPQEVNSAVMALSDGRTGPQPQSPLKDAVKRQNAMLLEQDEARQKELDELRQITSNVRNRLEEQDCLLMEKSASIKSLTKHNKSLLLYKEAHQSNMRKIRENRTLIAALQKESLQQLQTIKSELKLNKKKLAANGERIITLERENEQLETLKENQLKHDSTIAKLRSDTNNLSALLKEEKATSRAVISKVMEDAKAMMDEAKTAMKAAKQKEKKIEHFEKEEVREERRWSARAAKIGKLLIRH